MKKRTKLKYSPHGARSRVIDMALEDTICDLEDLKKEAERSRIDVDDGFCNALQRLRNAPDGHRFTPAANSVVDALEADRRSAFAVIDDYIHGILRELEPLYALQSEQAMREDWEKCCEFRGMVGM